MKNRSANIRREQRKSLLFREISTLFSQLSSDVQELGKIFPTRLDFTPGDGVCIIYFSCLSGEEGFNTALEMLKLYKPSMRKAISEVMQSRYTPEILFKYDKELEKELKIQNLLEKIKSEDPGSEE